jgi:hypothetical protein
VVVLASETTMTLQMSSTSGNAAALMKAQLSNNAQGNHATRIIAVKIA